MSDYFPTYYEVRRCKDPIVDEVALDRAMAGDSEILERLTALERDHLLLRLIDKYYGAEQDLNIAPDGWLENSQKPCKIPPIRVVGELWHLVEAWGMDYYEVRKQMEQRNTRKRRRAG